MLVVEGFEGPLHWLLEMARARKLDLRRLSIQALIDGFGDAMQTALPSGAPAIHAATLIAGLELARDGGITLDQDAFWQPIRLT